MTPVGDAPLGWDELFEDGTFSTDSGPAFYLTALAMAEDAETILEVGCGRGALVATEGSGRPWQDLRGPGRQVIGIDIADAGTENPAIDEFRRIPDDGHWPIADSSVDLAVCDFVLEHVTNPEPFVDELRRVLRSGGVFVARTVNRRSPLAMISRAVPNAAHARVLAVVQPGREARDVFPTAYRMNTRRELAALFDHDFVWTTASRSGLPHYTARWPRLRRLVQAIEPRLPASMQTALVLVARRS